MIFLGCFALALGILFYREVIAVFFALMSKSQVQETSSYRVLAPSGRHQWVIQRMLPLHSGLQYCPCFRSLHLYTDPYFWESLSTEEKEALLIWVMAAPTRLGAWKSLAFVPDCFGIDRAAVFLGAKSLALMDALGKLEKHRHGSNDQLSDEVCSGWTPIGPSWMGDWPPVPERLKRLSLEETKWRLAPLSPPSESVN